MLERFLRLDKPNVEVTGGGGGVPSLSSFITSIKDVNFVFYVELEIIPGIYQPC